MFRINSKDLVSLISESISNYLEPVIDGENIVPDELYGEFADSDYAEDLFYREYLDDINADNALMQQDCL